MGKLGMLIVLKRGYSQRKKYIKKKERGSAQRRRVWLGLGVYSACVAVEAEE